MMKMNWKRLTAFLMAVVLLIGIVPLWTPAAQAADRLQRGEFTFAPHTVVGEDLKDVYAYSDDFFADSAYEADIKLATMSMAMTAASISSQDAEIAEQYEVKNRNIIDLLEKIGFEDIESEYFKPLTNTMAVTIAHKQILLRGRPYTLLVVVPRSAGYEREWSGNFNVAGNEDPSLHNGFKIAVDIIKEKLDAYLAQYGDQFGGELKLWTMGYSRGAAVANMFGGLLHSEPEFAIEGLAKENTYVYTFGTPNSVSQDRADSGDFGYIHNYFSAYDPITMMPLPEWGFGRYGETHLLPTGNELKKSEMLALLRRINPVVYDAYVGGQDPDLFQTVVLTAAEAGLSFAAKNSSEDKDHAMKVFLEDRMDVLAELAPEIEDYNEKYQSMLCAFMELYFGMSMEQSDAFMGFFTGDGKILALLMAAEMFAAEYLRTYSDLTIIGLLTLGDAADLIELLLAFEENLGEETKATIMDMVSSVITEENRHLTSHDAVNVLQNAAAANMAHLLAGAMEAAEIDPELQIRVLGENNANMIPMIDFFGALLFRTDTQIEIPEGDEIVVDMDEETDSDGTAAEPLWKQLGKEMIGTAATVLKNSGSYMRVHNNEILISWLRTMDSTYSAGTSTRPSGGTSSGGVQEQQKAEILSRFTDLGGEGYIQAIAYCVKNGLMDGVNKTSFLPNGTVTRAMAVTVLWRLAGSPRTEADSSFSDVQEDCWYAEAVAWGKENGYITGISGKKYAPDQAVTREQIAAMLWRYAGCPSAAGDLSGFSDAGQVSGYAVEAVKWVSENEMLGSVNGRLDPAGEVTRGQFAGMIMEYMTGK